MLQQPGLKHGLHNGRFTTTARTNGAVSNKWLICINTTQPPRWEASWRGLSHSVSVGSSLISGTQKWSSRVAALSGCLRGLSTNRGKTRLCWRAFLWQLHPSRQLLSEYFVRLLRLIYCRKKTEHTSRPHVPFGFHLGWNKTLSKLSLQARFVLPVYFCIFHHITDTA